MNSKSSQTEWVAIHDNLGKKPKSLLKRVGWQTECSLLWSTAGLKSIATAEISERHEILKKKISQENATRVCEQAAEWSGRNSHTDLLAAIQTALAFDQIANSTDPDSLKTLAGHIAGIGTTLENTEPGNFVIQQLAGVELPITLALQLGSSCDSAVAKMDQLIEDLVDGDGWMESDSIEIFESLLCSWARCYQMKSETKLTFDESTSIKLEWMARQWIRLIGPNGKRMLLAEPQALVPKTMLAALLSLSSDRMDKKLAKSKLDDGTTKKLANSRLYDGCGFSEWAGVGVFQCGWGRYNPRIAIANSNTRLKLELANQTSLLSGLWEVRIKVDGKVVTLLPEHAVNVYHADEEVEFVEFEYESSDGSVLQRQILLARDEQFLILADAFIPASEGRIDYEATLPVCPSVETLLETDNREIYLKDKEIRSLVLPLALGEWKSDRSSGELSSGHGRLQLNQSTQGKALYAPLFFDLSPQRCLQPRTWRSLTVAEELKILGRDEAAAYRVQIGKQQWVIYRSLSGIASRTFLGENQMCEFFVGKTDGDTAAEELIQLE